MARAHGRTFWLQIRVVVYVLVIAGLFLLRNHLPWRTVRQRLAPGRPPAQLVVAGRDVAPSLLSGVLDAYQREYPRPLVVLSPGGTNQALDALLHGTANVAILCRPVSAVEQTLFHQVAADSVVCAPFAVGALVVLQAESGPLRSICLEELRDVLAAVPGSVADRAYLPDPNTGLWTALCRALGLQEEALATRAGVTFLVDETTVEQAVRADPRAVGVLSSLTLPRQGPGEGLRAVAIRPNDGSEGVAPTYEQVGTGAYPLYHYLYAACRSRGPVEAAMLVTYLTGERGQRRIERDGFLPAQHVAREVHITTHPLGEHR